MGTQKNRLNETVLLSTQNIMLKLMGKKNLQFYTEKFCLSKSMGSILFDTQMVILKEMFEFKKSEDDKKKIPSMQKVLNKNW